MAQPSMASKPKYTQQICKLIQSNTRLKEQVAGRVLHYWKKDLKGAKSKISAVFLHGKTFQKLLTAEAWSDADQAHAEKHLKPFLGQVVALENAKIASKGRTTVFHGKQIKLSYDQSTIVKKLDNNEKYGKALPLLTLAECSRLPSLCAISLVACIQNVSGPCNRASEGGDRPVSNLQVAFEDRKIDTAFWRQKLANLMKETLVPMGSPQFFFTRFEKMKLSRAWGAAAVGDPPGVNLSTPRQNTSEIAAAM